MQSITSPIIIICLHKIVKYFQEFIKLLETKLKEMKNLIDSNDKL